MSRILRSASIYWTQDSPAPTIEGQTNSTISDLNCFVSSSTSMNNGYRQYATAGYPPAVDGFLTTKIDYTWTPDWLNLATGCGGGEDGDITVTSTITLTRNVRYRTVTMGANGVINNRGFEFCAQTVIVSSSSMSSCLIASTTTNYTGASGLANGTAGGVGSQVNFTARPTLGGGFRVLSGGVGGLTTGTASTSYAGQNAWGGAAGAGGAGGAGSSGAGGGSATGGTAPNVLNWSFERKRLLSMDNSLLGGVASASADYLPMGCCIAGSGGGGGGNGSVSGGGGGAGGSASYVGRWRIGRLEIGSGTTAPIFDARGGHGGAGGSPASGNTGGGGGGGGSGGGCAIVIIGEVSGSLTNAINASGMNGGAGGNGFGTGVGGNGGGGGKGGIIYLKKLNTSDGSITLTITDNRATAGTAGGTASGTTGGTGGVGVTTTANL